MFNISCMYSTDGCYAIGVLAGAATPCILPVNLHHSRNNGIECAVAAAARPSTLPLDARYLCAHDIRLNLNQGHRTVV